MVEEIVFLSLFADASVLHHVRRFTFLWFPFPRNPRHNVLVHFSIRRKQLFGVLS